MTDKKNNPKPTPDDAFWYSKATSLLKGEMVRHRVTAVMLSKMLKDVGVTISHNALSNKIRRGSFSVAFFLQCMKVMQVQSVDFYMAFSAIPTKNSGEPEIERFSKLIDDDEPGFE